MTVKGLDEYMLPCMNKKIFGIECMGCGLQRSAAFLFKGEFLLAFKMYPAIYTIIGLLLFIIANLFFKFKYGHHIKIVLIFINVAIIVISYFIKMSNFH